MKNLLKHCSRIKCQTFCFALFLINLSVLPSLAQVWAYNVPGGSEYLSPDYRVSIEHAGKSHPSFVHYSYGLDEYIKYNMNLEQIGVRNFKDRRDMDSHSAAIFSFSGIIRVYVTVKKNAKHITLPLRSAKILPSSYNIPCKIVNDSTVMFILNRPEKVVVIANYDKAWGVFADRGSGHVPIKNWNSDIAAESKKDTFHGENLVKKLSEGYKNPLFIMALPPEKHIPDRNSQQTLIVKPGDKLTQTLLDQYKTVWFTPGVHDLSQMGSSPWHQTMINSDQTFYLEGGSYVMACFKKDINSGKGGASIIGRGIISGIKQGWVTGSYQNASQVIDVDTLIGVSVTDRATFGITGGHHIEDVTMLGAWHGNNDGPDYLDDCTIKNCFLLAHDDNLKLNNNTHAKHIVIWQLQNAHPIMVKEMRDNVVFSNCVVEDIDILAYLSPLWSGKWENFSNAAIACVNSRNIHVNNFLFRNIRIESPYLYRVFAFYNMDSNQPYSAPWFKSDLSSESSHTRINGVTFENITVNCPVIVFRSLLGSAYENSMSDLHFINLNINGTIVTEKNKEEFFEIEFDKIKGLIFQK